MLTKAEISLKCTMEAVNVQKVAKRRKIPFAGQIGRLTVTGHYLKKIEEIEENVPALCIFCHTAVIQVSRYDKKWHRI